METRSLALLLLAVGLLSLASRLNTTTCTLVACESHGALELRRVDLESWLIYWNDGCNTCSVSLVPVVFGLASLVGAVAVGIGSAVVRRAA